MHKRKKTLSRDFNSVCSVVYLYYVEISPTDYPHSIDTAYLTYPTYSNVPLWLDRLSVITFQLSVTDNLLTVISKYEFSPNQQWSPLVNGHCSRQCIM